MKKTTKVGIASREAYKNRTIAIAKGEYVPAVDEPKAWFESLDAFSQAEKIKPLDATLEERIKRLTKGVKVSQDEDLGDEAIL